MRRFVIEETCTVGKFSAEDLKAASQTSGVLQDLGTDIQWFHNCVTDDKICRVTEQPTKRSFTKQARRGNLRANGISQARTIIDPTTERQAAGRVNPRDPDADQEGLPVARKGVVPVERIELPTFGLQNRCTTAVLHRHPDRRSGISARPQAAEDSLPE